MKLPDDVLEYEATIYRDSFRHFVLAFWDAVPGASKLVMNWHIDFLGREMDKLGRRVARGLPRDYDLVVNVPFGTSKSTVISILFPAWVWTFFPECRFICGTHTDTLVLDFSVKSRAVILSEKYQTLFPHVQLDKNTESYFTNTRGGDRFSCTVGGVTPTGFHAHIILIDDPLDPMGARSEQELESARKFMTETIPSRKVDKEVSTTVLIMQRLEYRDPTQVMLKMGENPDVTPVRHVCLPGELSDNLSPPLEELRESYPEAYRDDDLLDPKRLPRRVLNEYRVRLGSAYWSQVMQKPMPPGGGMFKVQYFSQRAKSSPYQGKRIRYWDRAATEDGGCATAGVLISKDLEGFYYIEDVVWGQWDPFERDDIIAATALKDRVRFGPKFEPLLVIEEETGSTGKQSFKSLAMRLAGFRVKSDRPSGSKDVRAEPWSSALAAGIVKVVDNGESQNWGKCSWDVNAYVEEHCLFKPRPGKRVGGLCDRVDASSGAFNLLAGTKVGEQFKHFVIGESRHRGLRVVVCSRDNLIHTVSEHRSLLVSVQDKEVGSGRGRRLTDSQVVLARDQHSPSAPGEGGELDGASEGGKEESGTGVAGEIAERGRPRVQDAGILHGRDGAGASGGGEGDGRGFGQSDGIAHGLSRCQGTLVLRFNDLCPQELQDVWDAPVAPYDQLPQDLIMARDDAKKFWAFVLKKRDPGAEILVIQDDGDRRALSLAYAVCDVLHHPRSVVHVVGDEDRVHDKKEAPNSYVYDLTKLGRGSVV